MGKRQIKIEKIEEEKRRQICFSKRRKGLLSKAVRLSNLGCQMAIIIFSAAGQAFTFGNPSVHQVVSRYLGLTIEPPNQGLESSKADDDDHHDDHDHMEVDDEQKDSTPMVVDIPLTAEKKVAKRRKYEVSEEQQQKQQLACQDKVKNSPVNINISKRSNNCIDTANDHEEKKEKNKNSTNILALENSKDAELLLTHVEIQSRASLMQEENNNCDTTTTTTTTTTTSGSEKKRQMENKNETCNNRDEVANCEKESEENDKQFCWREAVDNLNLDQLLKLEEVIKEKQSKVLKLADKMLEERPLRLCSWVYSAEDIHENK